MKNLKKWVAKLAKEETVYVAGGGPLDLYMGRKPKDIDVFVEAHWDWGYEDTVKLAGQWCVKKGVGDTEDRYSGSQAVYWTTIDGMQVDIIGIPSYRGSVKELVRGFDFNICEAWVTSPESGVWDLAVSQEVKYAIKNKNIEYRSGKHINRHFNPLENNKERRVARYKEKFPDYTIWGKL